MGAKQHTKEQAATSKAFTFLSKQNTAVIATVNVEGRPNTSVIYYYIQRDSKMYFITKSNTVKYLNILTNPHVSLCVYDEDARLTVQASGRVHEVKEEEEQVEVMNKLAKVRDGHGDAWMPPVSQIKAGKLVVMRVEISELRMTDFKNFHKSDEPEVHEHLTVS